MTSTFSEHMDTYGYIQWKIQFVATIAVVDLIPHLKYLYDVSNWLGDR